MIQATTNIVNRITYACDPAFVFEFWKYSVYNDYMIIEFDDTDVHDISRVLSKLHKLRTALTKSLPEARLSNVRFDKRLASIQNEYHAACAIFETDLSAIYGSDEDKQFYVYLHCNPAAVLNVKDNARHLFLAERGVNSAPFYVGKGCGMRAFDLNRNEGHRKVKQFLDKVGKEIQVIKFAENLSEGEALAIESKLIDILGLKSISAHGMLVNLDEGMMPSERRKLYPKTSNGAKGSAWYLNRMKLQPYSVPSKEG